MTYENVVLRLRRSSDGRRLGDNQPAALTILGGCRPGQDLDPSQVLPCGVLVGPRRLEQGPAGGDVQRGGQASLRGVEPPMGGRALQQSRIVFPVIALR